MNYLQRYYANSQPDPNATYRVGQPVITLFDEDKQYYRAVITDIVEGGYKVQGYMATQYITNSIEKFFRCSVG